MTSVQVRELPAADASADSGAPPAVPIDSTARIDEVPRQATEQMRRWHRDGLGGSGAQAGDSYAAAAKLDAFDAHTLYVLVGILLCVLFLGVLFSKIRVHLAKRRLVARMKQHRE